MNNIKMISKDIIYNKNDYLRISIKLINLFVYNRSNKIMKNKQKIDIIICLPAFCIVILHSHFDGAKRLLI